MPHLLFEADREGFFGELLHGNGQSLRTRLNHAEKMAKIGAERAFTFPDAGDSNRAGGAEIAECAWKALKTRHFTTALYRRDSRLPNANGDRLFHC